MDETGLAQSWGCKCGDLGPAEDGLQRETHAQLQAGCEEGKEAPRRWVDNRVNREVGLEEERSTEGEQVGETRVEDSDRDEMRRDQVVGLRKEAKGSDKRARAVRERRRNEECSCRVNWRQDQRRKRRGYAGQDQSRAR